MKRLLWLLPFCFILSACPFESTVPLEPGPVEPVDSTLLGYWYGIVKDGSDYFGIEALDIQRQSDSTYAITRYGKSAKGDIILPDTAHFIGYTSYIGAARFMNIESSIVTISTRHNKAPDVKTERVYYLAFFENRQDTLHLKTITEGFYPGRKVFKTPQELKQTVFELNKQQNIYDDLYSLDYKRFKRPEPLKAQ